jgi:hypothetical protein
LQILSDVHVEHHADHGKSFIESLDPTKCDVLIIAGDFGDIEGGFLNALTMICRRYAPRPVLFVHGNHELYRATRGAYNATIYKAKLRNPNLRVLDRDIVIIEGQRFLGATLWFPDSEMARVQAEAWSDFSCIRGLDKWVWRESQTDAMFFRRELSEGDIAITHYLPSPQSVHPLYAGSSTNCYYVHNMEALIEQREPAMWIHGHTHSSMDYMLGRTRVVCNPFGYADLHMLNGHFRDDLIIEVQSEPAENA